MSNYEPVGVLALSAAVLLPAMALSVRAASLKGQWYDEWNSKVDLASAGLTERAINLLRELQAETTKLVGSQTKFDPQLALADPAPLIKLTRNFNRTIHMRKRLERQFKTIVILGALAPYVFIPFTIAGTGVATFYAGWHDVKWIERRGVLVVITCLALSVIGYLAFFWLHQRMTSAVIASEDQYATSRADST